MSDGQSLAVARSGELDWSTTDERVARHIEASVAVNTRRAYRQAWEAFTVWAAQRGCDAIPDPVTVARWLTDSADARDEVGLWRWSAGTLALRLSGLGQAAKAMGLPNPAQDEAVSRVLAGVRRERRERPRRAHPLGVGQVADVLAAMDFERWPTFVKATRDAAVLLVGLAGAFRRSELASLRLADFTQSPDATGAVHVLLARSKTDQAGDGAVKYLPRGQHADLCPACAVWRWSALVGLADRHVGRPAWLSALVTSNRQVHVCHDEPPSPMSGDRPWLRGVDRHGNVSPAGIRPATVAELVQSRVTAAGFNSQLFSGHSMRAGFITDAFAAGADVRAIQRQSGHRSTTVLTGYDREYTPGRNNAVTKLGF